VKPVDQTQFYEKGKSAGNCQQAATASLLGLDLHEVPNFIEAQDFWQSFFGFLRSRGLVAVELSGLRHFDCYHLAYGQSLRGISHAVVYRYGELAHDPHPSRAGLLNVDTTVLIIPADLAEFARAPGSVT
jgi:hypothetical protein